MERNHPKEKRFVRGARRLALIAALTLPSFADAVVARANGSIEMVSTFVEDCCPPSSYCPPTPGPVEIPTTPLAEGETSEPDIATSPVDDGSANDSVLEQPITPNTLDNLPAAASFAAGTSSLASVAGSAGGLDAPNMLGDFLGNNTTVIVGGTPYTLPQTGNRRFKVTENVSPIPQDRVYFNYNEYFDGLQVDDTNFTNLGRYSFGGEKTFADGLFSAELRMVVTDGFDAEQVGAALEDGVEFGNLQFSLKGLLLSSRNFAVGAGLTLTVPTAEDVQLGTSIIENETVFLAPYIGFVAQPSRKTFYQGFLQTDLVLGGDSVIVGGADVGTFQEQNFLFGSLSAGRWLYTDLSRGAWLNGIAGMAELHYSTTLNDADNFVAGPITFATTRRTDFLNATAGLVFSRGLTNLRVAAGAPLRGGDDDPFDAEFQVSLNRRF